MPKILVALTFLVIAATTTAPDCCLSCADQEEECEEECASNCNPRHPERDNCDVAIFDCTSIGGCGISSHCACQWGEDDILIFQDPTNSQYGY